MLVLGIDKILKLCHITSNGRTYSCPTKIIDNVLCFKFKNQWHKVAEYVGDYTTELIEESGKILSKKVIK